MSWLKPPPVVVIGGTELFLRDREINNAIRISSKSGRTIVRADSEGEAIDALTSAQTFGSSCLVLIDLKLVEPGMVSSLLENPSERICLLLVVDGLLDEKKFPVLSLISSGFQISHVKPTTKKEIKELAVRFSVAEASRLLKKGALDPKLAEALVNACGIDLGTLAQELSKISAYSRSQGSESITAAHIKALARPSTDTNMEPLREALRSRKRARVAQALDKIRRVAQDDPVMLLLRGRGGPADLVLTWLRAAVLLEKGAQAAEIASRLSIPEWAVSRDIIPAARIWGTQALRRLVSHLAEVDRGVLKGIPAPWVSCETALLLECVD